MNGVTNHHHHHNHQTEFILIFTNFSMYISRIKLIIKILNADVRASVYLYMLYVIN